MLKRNRHLFSYLFISVLLLFIISFFVSGFFGTAELGFQEVVGVIKYKLWNVSAEDMNPSVTSIVWSLRIPRALLAIAVGGGLAIAGAGMQAVTQNILAEPYMLGVSSGALTGVTVVYFLSPTGAYSSGTVISVAAFVGALIALIFVYHVGGIGKNSSNSKLILAGLSISVVLNSISNFLTITTPDGNNIRNIVSWMMGSLAGARWSNILLPIVGILLSAAYFIYKSRDYDLISIGDESALSLGVDVQKLKKQSVIIVSLIAALCVASAGLIGLVGFIVPHTVRLLIGGEHRKLFPMTFVSGSLFLMWMDICSRTLIAPQELPIGIFTALFGGPFFVWVLLKKKG